MSDEHRWRRKCFVVCLLALFIGLIGIVLPEIDVGVKHYINASYINQSGLTSFPCSINNISNIDNLNCTGAEGSSPFYIDFNFTNVTNFTNIETKLYYNALTGFSAHEVHLEIFCINEDRFIVLERFTGENQWQYFSNDILSYMHFIRNDGNVTLRINHTENGITSHRVIVDVVRLVNDPNFEQNIINLNQTIGGGNQNLSQVLSVGNQAIDQKINFTNTGKWLNVGYNNVSGLMEINTSSIYYYKQGTAFLGFTGSGFAYSAYNNKPMKFGESGTNFSQIEYNTTHGTRWFGSNVNNANANLNITGFDKINLYQELDLNNNALTNCSNCGGNQNLSQVLTQGNNANSKNIETLYNLNMSGKIFVNSTDGSGLDLNYSFEARHNNILRTFIYRAFGIQEWYLNDSTDERGIIAYSTPTLGIGILFFNASRGNRTDIRSNSAGLEFTAQTTGSAQSIADMRLNRTDKSLEVKNLAISGSGNYSLLVADSTGKIIAVLMNGSGNHYICANGPGLPYPGTPGC